MSAAPPLLDRAVIDDLSLAIGADGARSVLELFIDESRAYLAAITAAAAPGTDAARRERARQAAHSLKSGAGQVGAAALAAAATAVERAAAANAPDLAETATALAACATETVGAITRLLAEK